MTAFRKKKKKEKEEEGRKEKNTFSLLPANFLLTSHHSS
jgi:hypothetical protein